MIKSIMKRTNRNIGSVEIIRADVDQERMNNF